jgi:hypothetical protein
VTQRQWKLRIVCADACRKSHSVRFRSDCRKLSLSLDGPRCRVLPPINRCPRRCHVSGFSPRQASPRDFTTVWWFQPERAERHWWLKNAGFKLVDGKFMFRSKKIGGSRKVNWWLRNSSFVRLSWFDVTPASSPCSYFSRRTVIFDIVEYIIMEWTTWMPNESRICRC